MFRLICMVIRLVFFLIFHIPHMVKMHRLAEQDNPADDPKIHAIPKKWANRFMKHSGSNITVIGEEKIPEGPVVFIGNHESDFDIPLLIGYLKKPLGFVAKVETKKLPLISTWMEAIGCVFIDRKDRRKAIAALKLAIAKVRNGHSLVIFPEGTRNRGKDLLEFKPGSLRLAVDGLAPIVPIVIYGTAEIFEKNNYRVKPSRVVLKILEPISNETFQATDTVAVAAELQKIIEIERNQLKNEYYS